MQRFITVLFFIILSVNTFGIGFTPNACCSNISIEKTETKTCTKTCCEKPKKETHQKAHQCCQNISYNPQSFIVNKVKETGKHQTVKKKISKEKNNFFQFFSQFKVVTAAKTPLFFVEDLHQPPKLFIQYCSYLI